MATFDSFSTSATIIHAFMSFSYSMKMEIPNDFILVLAITFAEELHPFIFVYYGYFCYIFNQCYDIIHAFLLF